MCYWWFCRVIHHKSVPEKLLDAWGWEFAFGLSHCKLLNISCISMRLQLVFHIKTWDPCHSTLQNIQASTTIQYSTIHYVTIASTNTKFLLLDLLLVSKSARNKMTFGLRSKQCKILPIALSFKIAMNIRIFYFLSLDAKCRGNVLENLITVLYNR